MIGSSDSLLDNSVVPLSSWDMFLGVGKVEMNLELSCQSIQQRFELIVTVDGSDLKASKGIDPENLEQSIIVCLRCLVGHPLSCPVIEIVGDGCQEVQAIDLHTIHGQGHFLLSCDKFSWNLNLIINNRDRGSPSSLAFEASNVWTKDLFSCFDVF